MVSWKFQLSAFDIDGEEEANPFHFEGLPQFKWSDLGEQDVVGQGSFEAVFMVFDSSG